MTKFYQKKSNMTIIVKDYNKFNSIRMKGLDIRNVFSYGYWNVFHYSEQLEKFLKDNQIDYSVKSLSEFL